MLYYFCPNSGGPAMYLEDNKGLCLKIAQGNNGIGTF